MEGKTALFKPADDNCIYSPSTTNSYMNRVSELASESFVVLEPNLENPSHLLATRVPQGCYERVYDHLISRLNIVIGVVVGVVAVQLLGIIFAFCLCHSVGNERDYHYKY